MNEKLTELAKAAGFETRGHALHVAGWTPNGYVTVLECTGELTKFAKLVREDEQKLTEAMIDAPRQFLLYTEGGGTKLEHARKHMERCGASIESWPDWAKTDTGHITKSGHAIIVWSMMSAARANSKESQS